MVIRTTQTVDLSYMAIDDGSKALTPACVGSSDGFLFSTD
jgi:hypothetical protein